MSVSTATVQTVVATSFALWMFPLAGQAVYAMPALTGAYAFYIARNKSSAASLQAADFATAWKPAVLYLVAGVATGGSPSAAAKGAATLAVAQFSLLKFVTLLQDV